MQTLKSTFEKSTTEISVSLYPSNLEGNDAKYCKVTRNTVTLENMISDILDENHGMDPQNIYHAAALLKQQILKNLQKGNSVNILDLGNLYLAMEGAIKIKNPKPEDLPEFTVKFTPSSLVKEAVSKIKVNVIDIPNKEPYISKVYDEWSKEENTCLSKGKIGVLQGSFLKLGGVENPLRFIMVDNDGKEIENQKPVFVQETSISVNRPSEVRFYIPEELISSQRYKIKLYTRINTSNRLRKSPVSTETPPLLIR